MNAERQEIRKHQYLIRARLNNRGDGLFQPRIGLEECRLVERPVAGPRLEEARRTASLAEDTLEPWPNTMIPVRTVIR